MTAAAYIGIDPTAGLRAMTYAVLDDRLRVVALGDGELDEVADVALSYPRAMCGVDAPLGRNRGLLADAAYREGVGLDPGDTYRTYRVCEFELRRRGIFVYNTPEEEDRQASWMLESRRLYDALLAGGYAVWPTEAPRQMFETYPQGAFTALAGRRPYPKAGLEGRLQRQLVLHEAGINVPDPIRTLEEWTRYRLLRGELNLDRVRTHDELDALVSAYTAYRLATEPHQTIAPGDPSEGQIVLPVPELADSYA